MLSFCLLHSEMVAPKMEMKSSPCFLEVSSALAQGLDKRGRGKAAPLFQPQAARFHIFSALICYPCHACFITHILPPSQALRKGDQHPWEAISLIMCAKSLQSCLTLCDPMDSSPPGSSVQGILKARTLEWVSMSSSRGSSPGIKSTSLTSPALAGRFFTTNATWEALL